MADIFIEVGVLEFRRWLATRGTVSLIQALQQQAESWRSSELQHAREQIGRGRGRGRDDDDDDVFEALSRSPMQQMLHGPTADLQATESAERAERIALTDTLSKLLLRCPMWSAR